jgi:hypothetical protein
MGIRILFLKFRIIVKQRSHKNIIVLEMPLHLCQFAFEDRMDSPDFVADFP